ncbi:MerR family transcriptional regulator [uncultured Clostridium sp.]|uniref:MerR family transcriptional regulator n=1 Tax=uncultured Clostridium sp. TaxID=59620 RepID=UPI0028EE1837|nr:MerR family transcriptional regulator [uncultured Clostridium sp.]
MSYSTKDVTEKLSISKHTLRYYEKEGLLFPIARDKNGNREYSDLNLEQLILIRCMRSTGMSIAYIKDYITMCVEGYSTLPSRKEMLLLQKKILEEQKKEIQENLKVVNLKLKYYQELENNGPEEYDDLISKKHDNLTEKLMELLNKKNNV